MEFLWKRRGKRGVSFSFPAGEKMVERVESLSVSTAAGEKKMLKRNNFVENLKILLKIGRK